VKNAAAFAGQCVRHGYVLAVLVMVLAAVPMALRAAPYADYVMDARSGQVLHQTNAETRLHPASLTKMMTLYIAFEAIERGEISLDSKVTVSKNAAAEPPSKLGLRAGQTIALRYLIRAAAVKSANDAATAIGEAIEGSEAAFARRMTRTAKALGMTRTTFANANGLTAKGHLSTARDMAILGRRVFYDYPQYYNLFSRRTADAGIAQVNSTNRRFLDSYEGADGIKTGFTNPAGFNLVGSAQRGEKRIIAAVFGGTSTAQRNARMVELLDLGFAKAPRRATVQKPAMPVYAPEAAGADLLAEAGDGGEAGGAGKTLRLIRAVTKSPRPQMRPTALAAVVPDVAVPETAARDEALMLAMLDGIASAVAEAQGVAADDATGAETQAVAEAGGATTATGAVDIALSATGPATGPAAEGVTDAAAAIALAEAEPAAPADVLALAPAVVPALGPQTEPQPETLALAALQAPATAQAPAASPLPVAAPGRPATAAEPAPAEAVPAGTIGGEPAIALALAPEIPPDQPVVADRARSAPRPRPAEIILAEPRIAEAEPVAAEVITRVSTSGGREWGVTVGSFPSRYHAERALLKVALVEMSTLDEALLKVVSRKGAFDATFVGISRETAEMACLRLQARQMDCSPIGP